MVLHAGSASEASGLFCVVDLLTVSKGTDSGVFYEPGACMQAKAENQITTGDG